MHNPIPRLSPRPNNNNNNNNNKTEGESLVPIRTDIMREVPLPLLLAWLI